MTEYARQQAARRVTSGYRRYACTLCNVYGNVVKSCADHTVRKKNFACVILVESERNVFNFCSLSDYSEQSGGEKRFLNFFPVTVKRSSESVVPFFIFELLDSIVALIPIISD